MWSYSARNEDIDLKFVYYYLEYHTVDFQKKAKTGKLPQISTPDTDKFLIPVPPLEIQQEIVRILDNFTELSAELSARLKQYEFYRDMLLTFTASGKTVFTDGQNISSLFQSAFGYVSIPLAQIFRMRNGYTPSKSNEAYWNGGTIPWFRMEDIRENGRILSDSIQHITPQGVKGQLFPAQSIILATTATIGEHAMITVDALANQQFTCFTLQEEFQNIIDMKFAYYYFFHIGAWCRDHVNVSSFPSVDMAKLKQLPVPIPPLEKQREIVSILDRFDTLCHDLTVGLPAEIAVRQKQYEYYRDKLLTFAEKN